MFACVFVCVACVFAVAGLFGLCVLVVWCVVLVSGLVWFGVVWFGVVCVCLVVWLFVCVVV